MMAEYIEREKLYEFLTEQLDKETGMYSKGRNNGINIARSALHNMEITPSADVAPVRHGRWLWDVETHGDPMYGVDEDFGYRCSECKVWADEYGVDGDIYEEPPTHILHYCPNCGARMDGE